MRLGLAALLLPALVACGGGAEGGSADEPTTPAVSQSPTAPTAMDSVTLRLNLTARPFGEWVDVPCEQKGQLRVTVRDAEGTIRAHETVSDGWRSAAGLCEREVVVRGLPGMGMYEGSLEGPGEPVTWTFEAESTSMSADLDLP